MSLYTTCKPEIISLLFSRVIKVAKMSGFFSGVQRQNYWSDKNEQLYVVTYYKLTQLSVFFLLFKRNLKKTVF